MEKKLIWIGVIIVVTIIATAIIITKMEQSNLRLIEKDLLERELEKALFGITPNGTFTYGNMLQGVTMNNSNYSLTMKPTNFIVSPNNVVPEYNGSTYIYENVFPNVDLEYVDNGRELKENIRIKSTPPIQILNPINISFEITAVDKNNISLGASYDDDGSIDIINDINNSIFKIQKPFIDDGTITYFNTSYRIEGNKILIDITIPEDIFEGSYPKVIDPTVAFSSNDIEDVASTPVALDKFALAFCDETDDDTTFQVYYTNGTVILSSTDIDTSNGGCIDYEIVDIGAYNETLLGITYIDDGLDDLFYMTYDTGGNKVSGGFGTELLDSNIGAGGGKGTSIAIINKTNAVVVYADMNDNEITMRRVEHDGSEVNSPTVVESGVSPITYAVDVGAFDQETYLVVYNDFFDFDYRGEVVLWNGTSPCNFTIDDNVGTSANNIKVNIYNESEAGIVWLDTSTTSSELHEYIRVDKGCNTITSEKDLQTDADATAYTLDSTTINENEFAISWYSFKTDYFGLKTFTNNGTLINSSRIESNSLVPFELATVTSKDTNMGIQICGNNFITAWTTSQVATPDGGTWTAYNHTGGSWDGVCNSCMYDGGEFKISCYENCTVNEAQNLKDNNITINGEGSIDITGNLSSTGTITKDLMCEVKKPTGVVVT